MSLLVGRCRREHLEEIRDQCRGLVVPTAGVVEQPQAVGELSELLEVAARRPSSATPRTGSRCRRPSAPTRRRARRRSASRTSATSSRRSTRRAPGSAASRSSGSSPSRSAANSRIVSSIDSRGLARTGVGLTDETLVHQRAESVETSIPSRPSIRAATSSTASRVRTGEHGEEREQALLVVGEQLVAPVDRVAQCPLAFGSVACAARQQVEPVAEALDQRFR